MKTIKAIQIDFKPSELALMLANAPVNEIADFLNEFVVNCSLKYNYPSSALNGAAVIRPHLSPNAKCFFLALAEYGFESSDSVTKAAREELAKG